MRQLAFWFGSVVLLGVIGCAEQPTRTPPAPAIDAEDSEPVSEIESLPSIRESRRIETH